MFGDLGHGFIVTVTAALMIYYSKYLQRFAGDEVRRSSAGDEGRKKDVGSLGRARSRPRVAGA
mgnify:CR=1 FL=1